MFHVKHCISPTGRGFPALALYKGDNMNEEIKITISVRDDELTNKTDEELAELIIDKLRIEMNKIVYGKRGQ